MRRALLVPALLWALAGCAVTIGDAVEGEGGDAWVREEVYFGAAVEGGDDVSDREWEAFVQAEIAPRFPEGFTVLDGRGRWRAPDGTVVDERTRILVVAYPEGSGGDVAVGLIAAAYRRRYDQDAVLRFTDSVRARLE